MDDRAGTVAVNRPAETVKLQSRAPSVAALHLGQLAATHEVPEHFDAALVDPLITSQYVPAARDVVKVVLHAKSALLIATKPAEPRPKAI
jgi:hypothetical protein